jgi:hypothetical protein
MLRVSPAAAARKAITSKSKIAVVILTPHKQIKENTC